MSQVLYFEHCIAWHRDLDTKKIAVIAFREFGILVLKENGEDKTVRETN